MSKNTVIRLFALTIAGLALLGDRAAAEGGSIYDAILIEPDQKTQEVSTAQLRQILVDGSAVVLDSRPRQEFVGGHIPGAQNLNVPSAEHVAAVEKIVGGDKSRALVLYCNGPFCQASRRLADQLQGAGFRNVRRYQLGLPVWRALGGPTQIELEGITRIFDVDRTAVFFDCRPAGEFAQGSIAGAKSVPADKFAAGEMKDAPLPMHDFNTRIVLFGRDAAQARQLADALSQRPWHNVTYFAGTFEELAAATSKP